MSKPPRVCDSCGDQVARRWLDDGICVGCRKRRETVADGGRVQDERRQCARCDADAIPGSRFCLGHSEVLPDGGRSPQEFRHDPRNFMMAFRPVVIDERLADDTTTRVSVANVTMHESGALRFKQWDGREGALPGWRWTELEAIRTESFTDHDANKRRKRVAESDWELLPERVRDVFDYERQDVEVAVDE